MYREAVLTRRDLSTIRFEDMRLRTARICGLVWLNAYDVLEALGRQTNDEMAAVLDAISPDDQITVVVRGAGGEESEVGGFTNVVGAMQMALACSEVASPWSGAGRLLRWLASDALTSANPRRKRRSSALAGARRYGGFAVLDGGRA